jgi:hypothetical protein
LIGRDRPETHLTRFEFKPCRSEGLLFLQPQMLLFLEQSVAFTAKPFALIAILNRNKVLSCGKHKPGCQN